MSSGQAVSNLIVVVIVFFFAAFFVAAEFAIVSVRKSQIESMLEDGEGNKKKLEMALKMVDNMNEYLYMRRAFEFNDKVAKDVMIDRTSVEVVDITATVKDVLNKYLQEKHSRYPVVANNDKDKILGYVYIYDLIRQSRVDDTIKISKLLRTIISVPETTELQGLLRQMTRKRVPMVVVLDEYGGTSGIVTDRDIYEEVFGTVLDEADDVLPDDIIDNHNGTYKVSGKTTLYDFERYFGFQEKDFLESESVTLAGYLQDNYKIQLGTEVELGGLKVKVTEFNRNYVDWVEVCEMKK